MLLLVGVNIYFVILTGIYSKSKYAYLGRVRAAAARVRYEVLFRVNILTFAIYHKSYSIVGISNVGIFAYFSVFFVRTLVELRRTPFDYVESERELVSGVNTEYRSVGFVLLFIKEYGRLLFFCVLTSDLFFGGSFLAVICLFFLLIFVRSRFPRVRYDKLMGMMWLEVFFHAVLALFSIYFVMLL